MRYPCFVLLVLAFLSPNLLADEIKVAVGLALPPYVLSESNTGMELDIVKEALAFKGHTVKPSYLPFKRVTRAFESGAVDAAMTVNESSRIDGIHYSKSHITYQNVAVGLRESGIRLTDIPGMRRHSVIAFQNATQYLGNDFSEMTKQNKLYSEKAQQDKQITMLYAKRVDLIVLDINIFKYYKKQEDRVSTDAPIDIFEVFPPTQYKVGFQNAKIRDDFNAGLAELKKNGRYEEIINSYIN